MSEKNENSKSGLQRLRELAPALRESTERLKTHLNHMAAQQVVRASEPKLSAWGNAVNQLRNTKNG